MLAAAAAVALAIVVVQHRHDIADLLERYLDPPGFHARELERRRGEAQAAQRRYDACLADLVAAKLKEPLVAQEHRQAGVGDGYARKWAAEKSAAQMETCRRLHAEAKERASLVTQAERDLAVLRK